MPFAPYDYIILYNVYKVNITDCTFCKIRNDYYIVYNAKIWKYHKADCKVKVILLPSTPFWSTINGTVRLKYDKWDF